MATAHIHLIVGHYTMNEHAIQLDIYSRLGSRPDVRLFRNNVGQGYVGRVDYDHHGVITLINARRIRFGLHPGSGDLIGWRSITITPEMVGRRVAVFVSIETKSSTGRPTGEQTNWRDQIISAGGTAGIVRSAAEAEALL